MSHTFSTTTNPALYVELPVVAVPATVFGRPATDPPVLVAPRPPAGTPVQVRNAANLLDLPGTVTGQNGQLSFTVASAERALFVLLSLDGWSTQVGPVPSAETLALLGDVPRLQDAVAQLQLGGGGGGGGGIATINNIAGDADNPANITLTAAAVRALPATSTTADVPAARVSGLAAVATSGAYTDLTGRPANSIPVTALGVPGGVAVLDDTGKVPVAELPPSMGGNSAVVNQRSDQSWPARPSTPNTVEFVGQPGSTAAPPTGGSTAGGIGMVVGLDLYVQMPALL